MSVSPAVVPAPAARPSIVSIVTTATSAVAASPRILTIPVIPVGPTSLAAVIITTVTATPLLTPVITPRPRKLFTQRLFRHKRRHLILRFFGKPDARALKKTAALVQNLNIYFVYGKIHFDKAAKNSLVYRLTLALYEIH
jgi:hypothetical protein